MSRKIEVVSCRRCPFNFEDAGVFCTYKDFYKYDKVITSDDMCESELNGGLPKNCPLRIYKVLVVGKKFKEKNEKA